MASACSCPPTKSTATFTTFQPERLPSRRRESPRRAALVPLAQEPRAREALLAERRHQARLAGRIWRHPGTGEPYRNDAKIRRLWREVLAVAGVRYRPPYQLRHTYAFWLLTAGGAVRLCAALIARLARHSDPARSSPPVPALAAGTG